ncbi:hypothetical protein [Psychroserpens luteolus]|uniref:hypothetical protein n=1 Tax=Psychroserpens luteolus TaxID=2855840 RepID=UPI001E396A5E|nr:hypothetical protein [Psychroserpens luteolus]MCD2260352.1 hypothetical protein [Psychroserpens luteolus]
MMRIKMVVAIVVMLSISCQNETEDNRLSWIQNIDRLVSEYNKEAKIEHSETIVDGTHETGVIIYKKNSRGISKVTAASRFSENFPIKMEVYLKNDNIIMRRVSGLSPYIHKGQKREGDKCCALFENVTYFNSNTEVTLFERKLDLMSTEEMDSRRSEFESLVFTETLIENPDEEYQQAMASLKEFKDTIKK